MDKTQGIEQLFDSGMSRRQIARTLDMNRKSVDRHMATLESKGASGPEAPIGQAPTGSEVSKGAKALTGSGDSISEPQAPKEQSSTTHSRSECARYREQIIAKIEQGLTAPRIYQDLVSDYGFTAKYHSVRRFVGTLVSCKELPVRRIEVEAGQEMQIDYGQGARCMDHTGKLRKTYIYYRSIFDTVRDFLHDEAMKGHDRILQRYLKPDLLIIDDMGMACRPDPLITAALRLSKMTFLGLPP